MGLLIKKQNLGILWIKRLNALNLLDTAIKSIASMPEDKTMIY